MCDEGLPVLKTLIFRPSTQTPEQNEILRKNNIDISRAVLVDSETVTVDEEDPSTGNVNCSVNWRVDIPAWKREIAKAKALDAGEPLDSVNAPNMFGGNTAGSPPDPFAIMFTGVNAAHPRAKYSVKRLPTGNVWVSVIKLSD